MNSVKSNFLYTIIYQLLTFLIPLILSPYVARTIGVNGVGVYSYTYSIVYYFMLLTLLGVNNYGNRAIAKNRNNKNKLSKTFCEIYTLQLIMGCIMLMLYIFYILLFVHENRLISVLQSIFLISAIMDINWFFFGIEKFKVTITRNFIFKIGSIILVFIFVKQHGDLWKYVTIMSSLTLFGQLMLWMLLTKEINYTKVNIKDIFKHLKPNLVLFIPVIAVSLYKIMDKIMLGNMTNLEQVGYYENAEKLVNLPMHVISALGTVMLPRISNIISNGNIKKANQYIEKSIKFVMFLSIPMCLGLIAIGKNFAPIFYGKEFINSGLLIQLLSVTLPFLSFANVIRTQYLIPTENDKKYIKSVLLGAIINLIVNFTIIPILQSKGACIGTILAEFVVMFYQAYVVRKDLPITQYIKGIIPFIGKGIIMFGIIFPLQFLINQKTIVVIAQIFIGGIVYFILNINYIKSIINFKKITSKLKKRGC